MGNLRHKIKNKGDGEDKPPFRLQSPSQRHSSQSNDSQTKPCDSYKIKPIIKQDKEGDSWETQIK